MSWMLGFSATWIPKVPSDLYSFSSGPRQGPMPREVLALMARSSEQPENWLSAWDTSMPGLLSSDSKPPFSELLSSQAERPPAAPAGVGAAEVSSVLLLLSVGTVLADTLVRTMLAGTLDGTMPARVELMGNLDGAGLVNTEGTVPGGFELVGNLEGTVLADAGLAGTFGATVFTGIKVVGTLEGRELAGASAPLEQMIGSAWSLSAPCSPSAAPAEAKPGDEEEEEEEVPVDTTDPAGPGKRLALGVERARGWKETDGDTGPRDGMRLEVAPAVWVLPSSVSCS